VDTTLSTYNLLTASVENVGEGTVGDVENVFLPSTDCEEDRSTTFLRVPSGLWPT
jgi:hypothetical protein